MIDFQNVSFSYGEESHGGGMRLSLFWTKLPQVLIPTMKAIFKRLFQNW